MAESQKNQTEKENIVELKTNIYLLSIIGEVEGHESLGERTKATRYEHILPALARAEEDKSIDGLLILLNTVGGDVEAGLAIAEMIASMRKPAVSLVLGGGHSIGVPLAVAADYSLIVPSAPWSFIRCVQTACSSVLHRRTVIWKRRRIGSQVLYRPILKSPRNGSRS